MVCTLSNHVFCFSSLESTVTIPKLNFICPKYESFSWPAAYHYSQEYTPSPAQHPGMASSVNSRGINFSLSWMPTVLIVKLVWTFSLLPSLLLVNIIFSKELQTTEACVPLSQSLPPVTLSPKPCTRKIFVQ